MAKAKVHWRRTTTNRIACHAPDAVVTSTYRTDIVTCKRCIRFMTEERAEPTPKRSEGERQ